jgi:Putative zinc finger motif, C2HC5-type
VMPPRRTTTAWASPRGSLPSDRIRPPQPPAPTKSDKGKGKAKATLHDLPPSTAVRQLDELLAGLRSSSSSSSTPPTSEPTHHQHLKSNNDNNKNKKETVVDSGGCFCQGTYIQIFFFRIYGHVLVVCTTARVHALSEYTPICTVCGLVLCVLNAPYRPCPHCSKPLLAPPALAALITQLEELRVHTLTEEAAAREREAEELRLAEGAFPALNTTSSSTIATAPTTNTVPGTGTGSAPQRRVLSVDARTKRVKLESYSATKVVGSVPVEGNLGEEGEEESRVVAPPREVEYVRVRRGSATRWTDLKDGGTAAGGAKYVASSSPAESSRGQSEHGKGRGKKGKVRHTVPGAAPA